MPHDLPATLPQALARHVGERSDETALIFLRDGETDTVSMTYGQLDVRARRLAQCMIEKKPDASRVLLFPAPGLEFVVGLMACFYAGMAAVPCYPPTGRPESRASDRFLRLAGDCRPGLGLTDSDNLARARIHWVNQGIPLLTTNGEIDSSGIPLPGIQGGTLALIQYTSGSSGTPRGVMLHHANLMANLAAISERFAFTTATRFVSWLPPYHDMGLIGGILSALFNGYLQVIMEPRHFLQRPRRWLQAISQYRADTSGAPNFAYDLCVERISPEELSHLDLSCWELAFCGAETVRSSTMRRFAEFFARSGFPNSALFPTYGLAEVTLMATGVGRGRGACIKTFDAATLAMGKAVLASGPGEVRMLTGCGSPGLGTSLGIVDPDSCCPLAEGEVGEIWLAGDSIGQGYWNRSGESRAAFANRLLGEGETSWLRTGDLGFIHDGQLFINGRLKELLIIRGRNFHPPDLEEIIASCHPALALNGCAAFGVDVGHEEILIVAAEVRREARRHLPVSRIRGVIRHALSESFDLSPHEILLLRPGVLPRTTSGKISHAWCRERYLSEVWQPLVDPEGECGTVSVSERIEDAWLSQVLEHLAQLLQVQAASLDRDQTLGELGIDSLKRVELALTLEPLAGRSIDPERFPADLRLADLATLIKTLRTDAERGSGHGATAEEQALDAPGREVPMTPLQRAFLAANHERAHQFVVIIYLRTPLNLNTDALQRALSSLELRFDALRLRFHRQGGRWRQIYASPGSGWAFERIDVADLSQEEVRQRREAMIQNLKSGLDLGKGPLLKACFFDRGAFETGIIGLSFHHLVMDVVSVSIFLSALQQAYTDALSGRSIPGKVPPFFGRWLMAMDHHARHMDSAQVAYWRHICGENPEGVRNHNGPAIGGEQFSGNQRPGWQAIPPFRLHPRMSRQLFLQFPAADQRHDLFLAALARAWCEVCGTDHALVLLEHHGRRSFGAEAAPWTAFGWFVNRFPVRIFYDPERSNAAWLETVRTIRESMPDRGGGYGLLTWVFPDPEVRQAMARLRYPPLKLIYRGGIDEGFRRHERFPMIGMESDTDVYPEAMTRVREQCDSEFYVTQKRGLMEWTLQFNVNMERERALSMVNRVTLFIQSLLDGNDGTSPISDQGANADSHHEQDAQSLGRVDIR
ncbi:MAG: AMP-binding protein [Magnetococcales bacterium]|nr:AMP-binding protein [Magnetococcales bacterium]